MAESFELIRGNDATLSTIVYAQAEEPLPLTGASLVFYATNGTQTITKTTPTGILVDEPLTGAVNIVIVPGDTSAWPDYVAPLFWTLVVTLASGKVYQVDSGWMPVVSASPAPVPTTRPVYCTEADLDSEIAGPRLSELTAESGAVVNGVALARVLEQASSEIDRRLAGRYDTPIADSRSLALLVPVCVAVVKFKLFGRRDIATREDPTRVAYDEAQRWLRDIAKGEDSLPPTAALAGASSDAGALRMGSDDQVFGGGSW